MPDYEYIKDNNATSIKCGEGKIRFDHAGIHFDGIKDNEPWHFDLSYSSQNTLIIENDLTNFSLFINGMVYDFTPKRHIVGKLILVTEEMHRLHFNTWKNFSWNDWMYKGTELEKK